MSWDMNHRSLAMQGRFLCKARDAKDAQWLGAQHQLFGWRLVTSLAGEISNETSINVTFIHREWGFKAMRLQVLVTLGDGEWCYFDALERPSKTLRSPPWGSKSDFTYGWNMNEHLFIDSNDKASILAMQVKGIPWASANSGYKALEKLLREIDGDVSCLPKAWGGS